MHPFSKSHSNCNPAQVGFPASMKKWQGYRLRRKSGDAGDNTLHRRLRGNTSIVIRFVSFTHPKYDELNKK